MGKSIKYVIITGQIRYGKVIVYFAVVGVKAMKVSLYF
jgi:hypothetical protein